MAEFPDLLINPNPNAPTLDASGNQVRGINIFETTAERDALNATVRIPGALAIIKGSDELYQYTASTVDDTAWQDAGNWLGVGSAGGSGVQNLNNLDGNLTIVGSGLVTVEDDGNNTITIGATGGGVTDVNGETGTVTFTGTGAVDVDVITTTGQIDLDLTDTGVAAGTYTNATVQVDAQGRVLTATSGTSGGGVTDIDGETGSITLTAGEGIEVDVIAGTGEIEISSTNAIESFIELTDTQDSLLFNSTSNPYGGFTSSSFERLVGFTSNNNPAGNVPQVAGTKFAISSAAAPEIGQVLTCYDDDFNSPNDVTYLLRFEDGVTPGLDQGTGVSSLISTKGGPALAPSIRQISIGFQVGATSTTSCSNTVAIGGYGTLGTTQSGEGDASVSHSNGVFIGPETKIISGGVLGTHVGYGAGKWTSGNRNTFIGSQAGEGQSSGSSVELCVAVGYNAGNKLITGAGQYTAVGANAGVNNTTGGHNTYLGYEAGSSVTTGENNVYIGSRANGGATNSDCVAIGFDVKGITGGVSIGSEAAELTIGSDSVAIGARALYNNKGGSIVAIGTQAGQNGTESSNNQRSVYIGYQAGDDTSGNDNVAVGYRAGSGGNGGQATDGFNVAIGREALAFAFDASRNIAIGVEAMGSNEGGSKSGTYNVAIGDGALNGCFVASENVIIGRSAGAQALNAQKCVFIGSNSGVKCLGGTSNVGVGSDTFTGLITDEQMIGDFNVAIGHGCGGAIEDGNLNVFIGHNQKLIDTGNVKSAASMEGWDSNSDNKFSIGVSPSTYYPIMWGSMDMLTSETADAHVRSFNFQKMFNDQNSQSILSGRVYTYSSSTNNFVLASSDNDSANNYPTLNALFYSTSSDADTGFVTSGTVEHIPLGITGSVGDPVYLSPTAGNLTLTKPTATGQAVRIVGYVVKEDKFHFNGSMEYTIV